MCSHSDPALEAKRHGIAEDLRADPWSNRCVVARAQEQGVQHWFKSRVAIDHQSSNKRMARLKTRLNVA